MTEEGLVLLVRHLISRIVTLTVPALVLFVSGCIVTGGPLLDRRPRLDPLPDVKRPAEGTDRATVVFPKTEPEFTKGAVINRRGSSISLGQSVVINVPVDAYRTEEEKKAERTRELLKGTGYRGEAYFDTSEQLVEKALIKAGFNVIDRSKLEAKLRTRRDRGKEVHLDNDRSKQAAIDAVEAGYWEGKLTANEKELRLYEIEKRYSTRSLGSKRAEDEMVDISEVIRASEDGQVTVDYLLQINEFGVELRGDRKLDLLGPEGTELERLLVSNPGVERKIQREITVPWFTASCNAKLIDIETGAIVWLADLEVTSQDVIDGGFRITYEVDRVVSRTGLAVKVSQKRSALEELIDVAQRPVKGKLRDVEDELEAQGRALKRAKSEYQSAKEAFESSTAGQTERTAYWNYSYVVRRRIQPSFLLPYLLLQSNSNEDDIARTKEHVLDLARLAADTLISSIEIDHQ